MTFKKINDQKNASVKSKATLTSEDFMKVSPDESDGLLNKNAADADDQVTAACPVENVKVDGPDVIAAFR